MNILGLLNQYGGYIVKKFTAMIAIIEKWTIGDWNLLKLDPFGIEIRAKYEGLFPLAYPYKI